MQKQEYHTGSAVHAYIHHTIDNHQCQPQQVAKEQVDSLGSSRLTVTKAKTKAKTRTEDGGWGDCHESGTTAQACSSSGVHTACSCPGCAVQTLGFMQYHVQMQMQRPSPPHDQPSTIQVVHPWQLDKWKSPYVLVPP